MLKRQLANTDIYISPIGLGTVKFGRNQGVKYPRPFELPSDQQALKLLDTARELGVNLLDTAPAYGSSEQRLGKLLAAQRQHWIISTKVGEQFEQGISTFNFEPTAVRSSIERSLVRLDTDYLDIVQVHSNGDDIMIINKFGVLDQLAELKKQGLIRAFGMSTKTKEGGLLAAQQTDVVMLTYHQGYEEEREVLDYCAQNNKASFIKKAFASGHLCNENNSVESALNFVFSHPGVTSVISGTINPQHLKQNVLITENILNVAH